VDTDYRKAPGQRPRTTERPAIDPEIRIVKDIAAGAVLNTALSVLVIAAILVAGKFWTGR
jgi:diacylglycerol kinase